MVSRKIRGVDRYVSGVSCLPFGLCDRCPLQVVVIYMVGVLFFPLLYAAEKSLPPFNGTDCSATGSNCPMVRIFWAERTIYLADMRNDANFWRTEWLGVVEGYTRRLKQCREKWRGLWYDFEKSTILMSCDGFDGEGEVWQMKYINLIDFFRAEDWINKSKDQLCSVQSMRLWFQSEQGRG